MIQVEQFSLLVGAYALLGLAWSIGLLAVTLPVGLAIEFARTHR